MPIKNYNKNYKVFIHSTEKLRQITKGIGTLLGERSILDFHLRMNNVFCDFILEEIENLERENSIKNSVIGFEFDTDIEQLKKMLDEELVKLEMKLKERINKTGQAKLVI